MIKKEITNDIIYDNTCEDMEKDSYVRAHRVKISIFGILLKDRTFNESITKKEKSEEKKSIGFK